MEPTTVILILGLVAPVSPTRLRTFSGRPEALVATKLDQPTTVVLPGSFDLSTVSTQFKVPVDEASITPLQVVIGRIREFGAPGSADAISFLDQLPSGFPIPSVVHGEDDVISVFWDTENFYADVDFAGDGYLSVFTRERGQKTIDLGEDGIPLSRPFITWGYKYLTPIAPQSVAVA